MKRYRLKDKELQRRLDEISRGEFSKNLYKYDDDTFASYWGEFFHRPEVFPDKLKQFKIFLTPDVVETVYEYDPNQWNEWPGVEPPCGDLMRIEEYIPSSTDGTKFTPEIVLDRFCAYWDGRNWVQSGRKLEPLYHIRFRPWEEPDDYIEAGWDDDPEDDE